MEIAMVVELKPVPQHVAITMDGNRREGRLTSGDPLQGHEHGYEVVERIIFAARDLGIKHATFFTFSTENWRREEQEVKNLMNLFRRFFRDKMETMIKEGARIRFIGRRDRLPFDLRLSMAACELKSQHNTRINVWFAMDYGGQDEIIRAIKRLVRKLLTLRANPFRIGQAFASCLDTVEAPDVDLMIRTGGEQRISNFVLWKLAYAELRFRADLWPQYTPEMLEADVGWFRNRDRRMGGNTAAVAAE